MKQQETSGGEITCDKQGHGKKNVEEIAHPDSNIVYDVGMQTAHLNLFDILMVKGIRIYSDYWSDDDAPEVSCFDAVAIELYGGEARLSREQEKNQVEFYP